MNNFLPYCDENDDYKMVFGCWIGVVLYVTSVAWGLTTNPIYFHYKKNYKNTFWQPALRWAFETETFRTFWTKKKNLFLKIGVWAWGDTHGKSAWNICKSLEKNLVAHTPCCTPLLKLYNITHWSKFISRQLSPLFGIRPFLSPVYTHSKNRCCLGGSIDEPV